MTAITSYVVESGISYPKSMPKIYRLVLDGDTEISRYEIIDFSEVISLAPNIYSDFVSKYKTYLLEIANSINAEDGISTFNYYVYAELESSAMYITNNLPQSEIDAATANLPQGWGN